MIQFRGEISENCKRYIIKKEAKSYIISFSFALLTIMAPITIFSIQKLSIEWYWILILYGLTSALILIMCIVTPFLAKKHDYIPQKITIDDLSIVCEYEKIHFVKMVADVTKVIDMGDWYQIVFTFNTGSSPVGFFICQKNLITAGTIEEFETLFEGKIVRKY